MKKFFLFILMISSALSWADTIYEGQEKNGTPVFSDQPLANNSVHKTISINVNETPVISLPPPAATVNIENHVLAIPEKEDSQTKLPTILPSTTSTSNKNITDEPESFPLSNDLFANQINARYYSRAKLRKLIIQAYQNLENAKNAVNTNNQAYQNFLQENKAQMNDLTYTLKIHAYQDKLNYAKQVLAQARAQVAALEDTYSSQN